MCNNDINNIINDSNVYNNINIIIVCVCINDVMIFNV